MRIDVLTLFPEMFKCVLEESILKRAQEKKKAQIFIYNLRDWTHDTRRTVDDKPYGGGPGMVIKPEPVFEACDDLCKENTHVVLLTPQGKKYNQKLAKKILKHEHVLLICGHYEGFDERIRSIADEEISIGDYVLTCGEIPAMVIIDTVVRLIPGVLGEVCSLDDESFNNGLLEYPQYTRPAIYRKMEVPEILLSGDHKRIEEWRKTESLNRTKAKRKDLLEK